MFEWVLMWAQRRLSALAFLYKALGLGLTTLWTRHIYICMVGFGWDSVTQCMKHVFLMMVGYAGWRGATSIWGYELLGLERHIDYIGGSVKDIPTSVW